MDAAVAKIITAAVKKTVQEPEKAISGVAKFLIAIFILMAVFFSIFTSLIGCFNGADLSEDFDPMDAAIYRDVSEFYTDYKDLLVERMEERQEELTEEYTETITVTEKVWVEGHWEDVETEEKEDGGEWVEPPRPDIVPEEFDQRIIKVPRAFVEQDPQKVWVEGYWKEQTVDKEICTARINTQLNELNLAYILAYLTVTEEDILAQKATTVPKDKVNSFFDYVMPLKEKKTDIPEEDQEKFEGDEKYIHSEFMIYNDIRPVYDVADHYFSDDENIYDMFNLSFDLYLSFLGNGGMYAEAGFGEIQVLYHDGGISIPHYFQSDYSNVAYGNGTIASSGCALACIAMVVSGLKNEEISPVDVLKFTGNDYYVPGAGSAWSIFEGCARHYGLTCTSLGKNRGKVEAALQSGKPVIASMAPGVFTGGGHFIVIRGITPDGYFLVNDPNKSNYEKYGTDCFLADTVMKESKNFWSYE